jgi:hypothetical protein
VLPEIERVHADPQLGMASTGSARSTPSSAARETSTGRPISRQVERLMRRAGV